MAMYNFLKLNMVVSIFPDLPVSQKNKFISVA